MPLLTSICNGMQYGTKERVPAATNAFLERLCGWLSPLLLPYISNMNGYSIIASEALTHPVTFHLPLHRFTVRLMRSNNNCVIYSPLQRGDSPIWVFYSRFTFF